ncbi:hypothetical protein KCP76_08475 [Salmonella enterica subsp. enterica serovar Weltevreden]|nr:hypothetical protein KCP76_08475 [Salmonella enterica subsp. enterica serovar Weltevreden]
MLNVFWQIKVIVCEASQMHVSAVPGRGFCRNISSKPEFTGEAQCCEGLIWRHRLLDRKPRTLTGINTAA